MSPSPAPMTSSFRPLIDPDALATVTIRLEADAEPYAGKVAVAEVIRNRMKRRYSSDGTVPGTVLRKLQFSCWNTDDPRRAAMCAADEALPLSREARDAWNESEYSSRTSGAVLYHADYVTPLWAAKATFIVKIGRHLFYTE